MPFVSQVITEDKIYLLHLSLNLWHNIPTSTANVSIPTLSIASILELYKTASDPSAQKLPIFGIYGVG